MDQLLELLRQIQELAGVAIEGVEGALADAGGGPAPEGPPAGEVPPEEGGEPPAEEPPA